MKVTQKDTYPIIITSVIDNKDFYVMEFDRPEWINLGHLSSDSTLVVTDKYNDNTFDVIRSHLYAGKQPKVGDRFSYVDVESSLEFDIDPLDIIAKKNNLVPTQPIGTYASTITGRTYIATSLGFKEIPKFKR